jgi:hypothetical protein
VVESRILHEVPERSREARLRIGRTEHDTIDAGEHDRSGAHRTRLERHVQRAAVQPPPLPDRGGLAYREDLGMSRGVAAELALVPRGPDLSILAYDHRTDRDVAVVRAPARERQRAAHPRLVSRHRSRGAARR